MVIFIMDEEPKQPAIPPPDIARPSIPRPPDIRPPEPVLPKSSATPAVNVRIREAGDDEPKAGALAPFNARVLAALIDLLLAIGLQISAFWILPGFAERIAWAVGAGYWVARDSLPFLSGQSVGKQAMKIQVVTVDDKSIIGNWEAALVRNAVLLIPFFAFIELYILLSRETQADRGRRLGDEWAKTKVIAVPEPPQEDAPAG